MQTAIATVSLGGTLGEKLEAIAGARFSGIEIFENDLLSFNGRPTDARRIIADLGLQTVAFQPFRDFEGMPQAQRARVFSRVERKFDLMQELGSDLLLVCSSVSPDSLGGIDRAAADFHELGERAAQRGMRVAFEALAWGRHINDYRDSWEVVRRAGHPAVGLVLDSWHILARDTDLTPIRSIPKDSIFLVQIADAPRLDMDYLSWSRHYRCFPGQGDLAIDAFMAALQTTGFDGVLSLEIFSDRFRAGSTRAVAIDGQRSLRFMLDQLRLASGAAMSSTPPLPPPSRVEGIEFLEFAMDDASGAAFERVLSGLGFVRAGLHRTKEVTRWNQGDINIVVNREKEGFAHSFNITHGPSVCAMTLRVADAEATIERARNLLDQPFSQAVGPGELNIPAVRGLGGSLLYFVDAKSGLDRLWDVDFAPVAADAAPTAGLTRFDHLSQAMLHEEMLSWLLFYTSLLELRKVAVQDVLDPGGVVQSQAMEAEGGAVRLVLNASQSRHTLASRFLDDFFGSGVQQIALATDDIFASAEHFAANGIALLPIPENYYDDLEARTDLDAAQIDRMRAANILYDRDGGGEFLHVYTRTLNGGFFFEIVERRGYRGYGAVNAPIRLAAQARLARDSALPR
ncbi:MAG: sugar phosphate isomerase/epimerase and 4-hydroxyphenylpyruvate domain-containing protein [Alphaproteobacteria bacterium]|nr:sugar phosphate isomerase/epimerase and 4-hydroxyphenylpyruvate domain-containing protein [Alphaproteobacteria bacterium]